MQTEASWSLLGGVASIVGTRAYTVYSSATLGRQKVLNLQTWRAQGWPQLQAFGSCTHDYCHKQRFQTRGNLISTELSLSIARSAVSAKLVSAYANTARSLIVVQVLDQITDRLYNQTMDAQDGVIYFLLDQMADQHVKEQLLAYFILLLNGGPLQLTNTPTNALDEVTFYSLEP